MKEWTNDGLWISHGERYDFDVHIVKEGEKLTGNYHFQKLTDEQRVALALGKWPLP